MTDAVRTFFVRSRYALKGLAGRTASARLSIEPPRISLSFAAAVLLIAFAIVPLARCDARMKAERERDQWWVSTLKEKRGVVGEAARAGNIEIDAADAEGIARIDEENANARLEAAIRKKLADAPISGPRSECRIPISRLGLRK